MRGDDIHFRHGERRRTQPAGVAVHDEVIRVETLDVSSDLARPCGGALKFVAGFPAQNGFVIAITHAGQRVRAREDESNRLLEVGGDLRIGPEIVFGFAAPAGVFGAAAHPRPVVHERNNQAHALFVGGLQHAVERNKRFFAELAGRENVLGLIRRVIGAPH